MAQEIEVKIRIRVSDEQLLATGISVKQFAENLILMEHGFNIPSIVLSQKGNEAHWQAAIVSTEVMTDPEASEPLLFGSPLQPEERVLFSHTFVKGDTKEVCAQACVILQSEYIWSAQWREIQPDGEQTVDVWLQGSQWDEIFVAFRKGIHQKLQQGYINTPIGKTVVIDRDETELEWKFSE